MALIVPVACISITLSAIIVTFMQHREPDMGWAEKKTSAVEVPGDTVEMFVELEAEEEVGERERGRVYEVGSGARSV